MKVLDLKLKLLKIKDTKRLIKLLKLSASNNDAEALNAIRQANNIVAKLNTTWDDMLEHKIPKLPSSIPDWSYYPYSVDDINCPFSAAAAAASAVSDEDLSNCPF